MGQCGRNTSGTICSILQQRLLLNGRTLPVHITVRVSDLGRFPLSQKNEKEKKKSVHVLDKFLSDQIQSLYSCYVSGQDDASSNILDFGMFIF